jgi:lysylphosphatidylglycerol synthetase-like protein (DUF2156 family)
MFSDPLMFVLFSVVGTLGTLIADISIVGEFLRKQSRHGAWLTSLIIIGACAFFGYVWATPDPWTKIALFLIVLLLPPIRLIFYVISSIRSQQFSRHALMYGALLGVGSMPAILIVVSVIWYIFEPKPPLFS